jgi:hypothetical protein
VLRNDALGPVHSTRLSSGPTLRELKGAIKGNQLLPHSIHFERPGAGGGRVMGFLGTKTFLVRSSIRHPTEIKVFTGNQVVTSVRFRVPVNAMNTAHKKM